MKSIRTLFVVGKGPSSSHTMGPVNACKYIINKYKDITKIVITLTGSLAITGKGHLTDIAIQSTLKDYPNEIVWDTLTKCDHPNTMFFNVETKNGTFNETIISIGGGSIVVKGEKENIEEEIYPHSTMSEILEYCKQNDLTLADYVRKYEKGNIDEFARDLINIWNSTVQKGLDKTGYLPLPLKVQRKAHTMYERLQKEANPRQKKFYDLIIIVCATAVAEENASGETIITAPTCGSAGVIPGCLAYLTAGNNTFDDLINGVLTAGLIGMIVKTNGSISGAEAGCQAEIGVACAMGAGLISAAKNIGNYKVAQASEIALEHSLGLTCDPVGGYVMIPCIERNAMYALKAKDAYTMAKLIPSRSQLVSFDDIVKTMVSTGKDIQEGYRETSKKGLANLDLK